MEGIGIKNENTQSNMSLTSKRSRDEDSKFNPRKKISLISNNNTSINNEDISYNSDKTYFKTRTLDNKTKVHLSQNVLVNKPLVYNKITSQTFDFIKGNIQDKNDSIEVLFENSNNSNLLLNKQETLPIKEESVKDPLSLESNITDNDVNVKLESVSHSFKKYPMSTSFSSELPFAHSDKFTSYEDSDHFGSFAYDDATDESFNVNTSRKKKKKKKNYISNENEVLKPMRANYFVAVQVSNPEVR